MDIQDDLLRIAKLWFEHQTKNTILKKHGRGEENHPPLVAEHGMKRRKAHRVKKRHKH